jgi:hypothetical protein
MSLRQKLWLTIALVLFAIAHVGGAFMLTGASPAKELGSAQLIRLGD